MKTQKIIAAITAASLAFGSVGALAQPRGEQRNQRGSDDRPQRHDERNAHRGDPRGQPSADHRGGNRGNNRPDFRHEGRGAGPDHSFHRGGRLPPQYRARQYVVNDWRGHHLNPPPRGYQWVQAGGDYVMVAIATGIIASILLSQ